MSHSFLKVPIRVRPHPNPRRGFSSTPLVILSVEQDDHNRVEVSLSKTDYGWQFSQPFRVWWVSYSRILLHLRDGRCLLMQPGPLPGDVESTYVNSCDLDRTRLVGQFLESSNTVDDPYAIAECNQFSPRRRRNPGVTEKSIMTNSNLGQKSAEEIIFVDEEEGDLDVPPPGTWKEPESAELGSHPHVIEIDLDSSVEWLYDALMSTSEEFANNNHVKLSELQLVESEFGMPLEDCYKTAIRYYKEKEKSGELAIAYDDRVKLMALTKQVRNGPLAESNQSAGWFDFVGSDITKAWKDLGAITKEEAMASFVFMIDRVCPPFKNILADAIEPVINPPQESSELKNLSSASNAVPPQPNWEVFEAQRKQIQAALNAQTYHQFSAYAQQQFPNETEQQEALIHQLQEQHYQQYMAQVYAQQAEAAVPESERRELTEEERRRQDDDSDVSDEEPGDDLPSNPAIAPASLWNRKDIQEFKNTIKKEGNEGIIKVGHGETVTIRVPTHEDGTCLFWEFATDHYDIGFGVYFEWTIADSNQVSIHVSESDEEDEYEEGAEEGIPTNPSSGDVESGTPQRRARDPSKPRQDEIIPVYRRDCHEEVYAGSHVYPGRGVYLLKFDNSYSLWRSKSLYYRVYYSK